MHAAQVPMDQGAHSLDMIHKFTRNRDLAVPKTKNTPRGSMFASWPAMLRRRSAVLASED